MTSSVFTLSFVVLALATSCLTLPIFDEPTSTSFPVNLVEGHLPRAFTNEMELFTSTLFTPLFKETTDLSHHMMKKENDDEDKTDVTKPIKEEHEGEGEEEEETDRSARNFVETNTFQPQMFTSEKSVENIVMNADFTTSTLIPQSSSSSRSTTTTTTLIPSTSSKKSSEKFVGHFDEEHEHDDDDDHETTKRPKKTTKVSQEEKHQDESESDELTTKASSAPVAEFDPTVFDSVSTPMGNQLQFDENHQSIPQLTTETIVTEHKIDEEHEEELTTPKVSRVTKLIVNAGEREVIPTKLNQGEKSTIPEEKKSDH